jgi:large subunit ribosomal protein L25
VKRGGTVNIVNHTVELEADVEHIPQFIEVDVSKLEINNSLHLSDVALPKGVKPVLRDDVTLVTVVPPSGMGEEAKPAAEAAAAAPAAGAAAPAAGAAAPAAAGAAKAPAAGGDKKK